MNIKPLFEILLSGNNLDETSMQDFMYACMSGELTDTEIAVFLALMRMKGETITELATAAHIIRQFAKPIDLGEDLFDIVGTGGDGKNIFNVSTAACFVAAAAGIKVAKHGNRAVSSQSGSADLLELAGIQLNCTTQTHQDNLKKYNLTFLFAPEFHPALQYARTARHTLGFRTLFNLLGPLLNPACAKKQVIGVYDAAWLKPVAQVLATMGSTRSLVVHSRDGLDEISIADITDIVEYYQGNYKTWQINPKDYGLYHASYDDLIVNSPRDSLHIIQEVFSGKKAPLAIWCS